MSVSGHCAALLCTLSRPACAGGIVGSSLKLLDELIEIAPSLGIHLQADDSLSEAEAARLFAVAHRQGEEFESETRAWLTLHQAAELSLLYQTAVRIASGDPGAMQSF